MTRHVSLSPVPVGRAHRPHTRTFCGYLVAFCQHGQAVRAWIFPITRFSLSPRNDATTGIGSHRLFGGARWIRTAGPGCSIGSGQFLPVSVSPSRLTARLKRTGEGLASDSDQSDVYVCPAKERAGMKRNPSRSGEEFPVRALSPALFLGDHGNESSGREYL